MPFVLVQKMTSVPKKISMLLENEKMCKRREVQNKFENESLDRLELNWKKKWKQRKPTKEKRKEWKHTQKLGARVVCASLCVNGRERECLCVCESHSERVCACVCVCMLNKETADFFLRWALKVFYHRLEWWYGQNSFNWRLFRLFSTPSRTN